MSNRKVIVEFESVDEVSRFMRDLRRNDYVVEIDGGEYDITVYPYEPQAHNEVSGNATGNVVQCQNIDGGVHL